MKRILLLLSVFLLSILSCINYSDSKSKNWVFDQENVLTDDEEKELNDIIVNFEKETTNEIAIVTTDNIGEHKKMVFYAVEFGDLFGIGKKDKDNGLIIVFSKALRESFIATGTSTENILKDEICKEISDSQMVPEFKEENYYRGFKNGLEECIRIWKEKE